MSPLSLAHGDSGGDRPDTPLHWTASNHDLDVAVAVIAGGADLNWVPEYAEGTPLDAARGEGTQRENVIGWLQEIGAQATRPQD
ncbi:MAG TPA: ankyrin repeat domain-containing protein [Acidimicrobiales bacterium]|nr:ankyrin repeat domain-containing protein [Acidimicrobiales bacterium]